MTATINGIKVTGSPKEIAMLMQELAITTQPTIKPGFGKGNLKSWPGSYTVLCSDSTTDFVNLKGEPVTVASRIGEEADKIFPPPKVEYHDR